MAGRFESKHADAYVALIAKGELPIHAAAKIGFTLATIKNHLKHDESFRERVDLAAGAVLEDVEGVLLSMALDRNLGAIKFYLTNRDSKRWVDSRTINQQISGPDGGPVQVGIAVVAALREVIQQRDPDELERTRDILNGLTATRASRAALPYGDAGPVRDDVLEGALVTSEASASSE
jgi:hypothetical protein